MNRIKTKKIRVGNMFIGGDAPISIQSMLNFKPKDLKGNIEQAVNLQNAGCEVIRFAVPDIESVKLVYALKEKISVPLVADIHFDYRIALECVAAGIDKIRINPGNIGDENRIKEVVKSCRSHNIPIRIGVNSGSVEKDILAKYGHASAQALCESALHHVSLLEKFDFDDIIISIKSSNVNTMIEAYKLTSSECFYPLHLGVTEAGTEKIGIIKSSIGIGSLLSSGIGDTIRVSLTDDPLKEVWAGKEILKSLGLRKGINLISCPTCGRTNIDLISLAKKVEEKLQNIEKDITVAVMGCEVNGPGEAKSADIGIASGKGVGLIFRKGEIIKTVKEEEMLEELLIEIDKL